MHKERIHVANTVEAKRLRSAIAEAAVRSVAAIHRAMTPPPGTQANQSPVDPGDSGGGACSRLKTVVGSSGTMAMLAGCRPSSKTGV